MTLETGFAHIQRMTYVQVAVKPSILEIKFMLTIKWIYLKKT